MSEVGSTLPRCTVWGARTWAFTLHGSVGRSGADNHRPDVAKVETFLGDAGYYKPLTQDGPSGWHSPNLDSAIRAFQKDHGLAVDGVLKPNGPTIGTIGSRLGGGAAPKAVHGGSGGPDDDPPTTVAQPAPQPPAPRLDPEVEALIRILNGGRAPKSPFGSAQGADRWAAGNMAEVIDYADAVRHFRTDRTATMPYLAAVHEIMAEKSPMQAMKFTTQMRDAGLAMAADTPEPPQTPADSLAWIDCPMRFPLAPSKRIKSWRAFA